jgi:hypothetical protein
MMISNSVGGGALSDLKSLVELAGLLSNPDKAAAVLADIEKACNAADQRVKDAESNERAAVAATLKAVADSAQAAHDQERAEAVLATLEAAKADHDKAAQRIAEADAECRDAARKLEADRADYLAARATWLEQQAEKVKANALAAESLFARETALDEAADALAADKAAHEERVAALKARLEGV